MIITSKIVLSLTLPLVNNFFEPIIEKPNRINVPYVVEEDDSWINKVNSSRPDKIITNKDVQFKIRIPKPK